MLSALLIGLEGGYQGMRGLGIRSGIRTYEDDEAHAGVGELLNDHFTVRVEESDELRAGESERIDTFVSKNATGAIYRGHIVVLAHIVTESSIILGRIPCRAQTLLIGTISNTHDICATIQDQLIYESCKGCMIGL